MNLTWLIQNQDIKRARREEKEEKNILQSTDFLYDILFPRSLVRIFMTGFMRFSLTFSANFVYRCAKKRTYQQKKSSTTSTKVEFTHFIIGHNLFTCRFFGCAVEIIPLYRNFYSPFSLSPPLSLTFLLSAWHSTLFLLLLQVIDLKCHERK